MSDSDIERRLQRLEDLEAIRQLFVDYGRHLDACEFDAYAELFTSDGEVLLGPLGRAKGREAIRELMTSMVSPTGESFHLVTSPVIDLAGDTATSSVMWTVIHRQPDGSPRVTMIGRHEDDLVRDNGRWRFARRRGFVDLPSTYPIA